MLDLLEHEGLRRELEQMKLALTVELVNFLQAIFNDKEGGLLKQLENFPIFLTINKIVTEIQIEKRN